MSADLVRVPYREGLDCVREGDTVWVAVYRVCENLELGRAAQQEKLKKAAWASSSMIELVGDDGKKRKVFCVDLKCLAMWLAGIDVARVAAAARPRVAAYQVEASDVLYDYFFGGRIKQPSDDVRRIREERDELRATVEQLRAQLERAELGSNSVFTRELRGLCKALSAHYGQSVQKIYGIIRREFRVSGWKFLTVTQFTDTVRPFLFDLLSKPKPAQLPSSTKQLWLPGELQ